MNKDFMAAECQNLVSSSEWHGTRSMKSRSYFATQAVARLLTFYLPARVHYRNHMVPHRQNSAAYEIKKTIKSPLLERA